ncbi:unnamed protein product [Sphagnum troendelagicum]|uniref:Calcium-transporting ATPase n=1 Tax=Sphagnum troendelagicum TaxID=128251 RepID=A0ABP0TVF0_9BRYO
MFKWQDGNVSEVTGSPTERAVLNWGLKLGVRFREVRKDVITIGVATFNSTTKKMGICIRTRDGKTCVHWKGAAEIMLELCTHTLEADGSITPLTPDKMEQLNATISKFANSALRTLCFAYRDVSPSEVEELAIKTTKLPDQNLICIAIVGIKDPCRFGVPESVARCQQAGIKVRMVTGDNLQTAKAIAEECGICTEGGIAIEGKTFRAMTIEQQYNVIPSIDVMARSSPSDKHILVKRLLERGEIVAVTGDGTNDAPALHEASIGLAMGIAGTEVAKESSDIIILDDNFASIVKVVRWGRSIYCNIQKFIQFQTTVNGVALSLNFITAIASGNAPLTAVQLLWVNLIMDTLGALALATEQPTESLMLRPPIGVDEPLITNIMWRNIVGQSLYQLLLLLVLHFKGLVILGLNDKTVCRNMSQVTGPGLQTNSEKVLQTIIFNAFVFCQVLIVEFAGNFTSTVKLDWQMWILCLVLGVLSMPLAMLIKLIPVPDAPFITYLTPWREHKKNVAYRNGRKFSKGFDEHQERAEIPMRRGSQFFEAIIGNEMVRVPIPDDLPPLLPTEVEPFSKRLKYAIFPYSHAEPSVMSSSCNPQANIAWT